MKLKNSESEAGRGGDDDDNHHINHGDKTQTRRQFRNVKQEPYTPLLASLQSLCPPSLSLSTLCPHTCGTTGNRDEGLAAAAACRHSQTRTSAALAAPTCCKRPSAERRLAEESLGLGWEESSAQGTRPCIARGLHSHRKTQSQRERGSVTNDEKR